MAEHKFKPFDKVLVRRRKEDKWHPEFFWKYSASEYRYVTISGGAYPFCIPYKDSILDPEASVKVEIGTPVLAEVTRPVFNGMPSEKINVNNKKYSWQIERKDMTYGWVLGYYQGYDSKQKAHCFRLLPGGEGELFYSQCVIPLKIFDPYDIETSRKYKINDYGKIH